MYDTGLGITAIELVPEPAPPLVTLKAKPFRKVSEIKAAIAKRYRITVEDLESPCRAYRLAHPRQLAMAMAYKKLKRFGYSTPMIGREFGGRDHTTVLYACRKYGIEPDPKHVAAGRKARHGRGIA